MKRTAILAPLALLPVLAQQAAAQQPPAQQPKFELADVHVSPTAFWFAQNTNGQIRPGLITGGLYIYRDATLLSLIQAAYGVPEDWFPAAPVGSNPTSSMSSPKSPKAQHQRTSSSCCSRCLPSASPWWPKPNPGPRLATCSPLARAGRN
jgi:hypothetical protein